MDNPFEILMNKLLEIESLLLDIKHQRHPEVIKEEKEQFLTVKQAAEFLGLSTATVYTKVSKQQLPVMKRGNRLYFSEEELIQYLKDGRRKTNQEIEREADDYLAK